jgi:hypothetical protein
LTQTVVTITGRPSTRTDNISVNILIQGPTLKLQYITVQFESGSGTYTAYDPQLFGTTAGVSGTYTGTPFTDFVLTSEGCVLTLNGTLYGAQSS